MNYGVQRSDRGGAAVRAVSLLPVLTGAWRDSSGGLLLTTSGAFQLDREALERQDLQTRSPLGRTARVVNMSQLGHALLELDDPAVHALVVYNSNPAAIAPDQNRVLAGLHREDLFTVVLDQLQTDTADYADLLLPATTFLEHTDLYFAYGHYYLQLARPALPAPGEARSNFRVFRELAIRMGFDEPCLRDGEDDVIRQALGSGHPFLEGITLDRLEKEHFIRLNVARKGEPFLPFAEGGFDGPSGRCRIDAARLAYEPPAESRLGDSTLSSRFPLELVSPKADNGLNSTFGNRSEVDSRCGELDIHPGDADARGIASGDAVRVFNARGSCSLSARVTDQVHPGVVSTPSVRWRKVSGQPTVNVLTSERLTDEGGGPTFYSCLVEVEPCS